MSAAAPHPFADLIGFIIAEQRPGSSMLELVVRPAHLNPHGVVHGAVLFALADTGMGAALVPTLEGGQRCVSIEVKISYFRAVREGTLQCRTELVHRGRTLAHLTSRLTCGDALLALADGNFAVVDASSPTSGEPR